ncbi:MAG TPA: hypothetical protein DCR40_11370 [Prolixibacteraceae bacterium]|nr:hypothetical protein [Prolixibacteraceae bacterium]
MIPTLKRAKFFLLMLLSFLLFVTVHAQTNIDKQTKLAEQFHAISDNAPAEIAYIQTSKDIYETGEDLWFKVYLLDSKYLMPSLLSKTLYLQLLNSTTRKAVWEEKYEIQDGFSNGRVYLESSLPEGDYLLAVYTENSFYQDTSEFKAVKRIIVKQDMNSPVSEPLESVITDANRPNQKIQFTTFPEGGNLVSGIQSKLAFKAVNPDGKPVDIEGTLFENSEPIQKFKSFHAGIGSLEFTPDVGKKYQIRLTQPSIDSTFLLPEIAKEGMTLNLADRDKDTLTFKIAQSPILRESDFYVRVQCRGVVYAMASGKVNGEIRIKLPLSLFPQGIAEVTLFNGELVPVAERLVYLNPNRKLYITSDLSKHDFPTRGKVNLKITAKDESGYPVSANLGVSVFDQLYQNTSDSSNILSHIYLSSQLKGRIYNPSYYFNIKNKGRDEALDLLMLTQGWRKYIWSDSNLKSSGETKEKIIFDDISGKIYYPRSKKKIPKEQLFVLAFSPNIDSTKLIISADSLRKFTVSAEMLKEWENDYVYLKPFGPYESKLKMKSWDPLAMPEYHFNIQLTDPFETINRTMKLVEVSYPLAGSITEKTDTSGLYSVESGVVRIKDVSIKGKRAKIIRGKYLGTLDSIAYNADDYICRMGVLNCPRHDRNEIGTIVPTQGKQYSYIIDYNTPMERTRIITYWRNKYNEADLLKVNNLWRIKAYYGKREFYKPDYDKETGEVLVPDFRNTLFWEPSVITDENGEATLSFFCSDINTDFVGRVEGVSEDGLSGAGTFKFTVRKEKFTP